jgi:two-component system NarL family sensor kinase
MASHAHLEAFKHAQETGKTERAANELEQGLRFLKEAVVESRRLVNGLRLLALDDLGLAGALEQLVTEEKVRAGWQDADFVHNLANQRYSSALETTVYRVAQEALTNARKHAHAVHVSIILLTEAPDGSEELQLALEVQDWGQGFVQDEKTGDYSHVGLQGMFERVRLVGGGLTVQSSPGNGTRIRAVFPIILAGKEENT